MTHRVRAPGCLSERAWGRTAHVQARETTSRPVVELATGMLRRVVQDLGHLSSALLGGGVLSAAAPAPEEVRVP